MSSATLYFLKLKSQTPSSYYFSDNSIERISFQNTSSSQRKTWKYGFRYSSLVVFFQNISSIFCFLHVSHLFTAHWNNVAIAFENGGGERPVHAGFKSCDCYPLVLGPLRTTLSNSTLMFPKENQVQLVGDSYFSPNFPWQKNLKVCQFEILVIFWSPQSINPHSELDALTLPETDHKRQLRTSLNTLARN